MEWQGGARNFAMQTSSAHLSGKRHKKSPGTFGFLLHLEMDQKSWGREFNKCKSLWQQLLRPKWCSSVVAHEQQGAPLLQKKCVIIHSNNNNEKNDRLLLGEPVASHASCTYSVEQPSFVGGLRIIWLQFVFQRLFVCLHTHTYSHTHTLKAKRIEEKTSCLVKY